MIEQLMRDGLVQGLLRQLDVAFAALLAREAPEAAPELILAAALVSRAQGRGQVSLGLGQLQDDVRALLEVPAVDDALGLRRMTAEAWRQMLDCPRLVSGGPGDTPLVLAADRLYLRRYWRYEQQVRSRLQARMAWPQAAPQQLRPWLEVLFPPSDRLDWQKLACALAARSGLGVITGGPGTGKTTTVVKLLALLQAQALAEPGEARKGRPLRIRLAAPTGKAAARLNESVAGAVARLPLMGIPQADAVRASIPTQVATLHRLLGSRADSRRFRHHAGQPLALDVLVIDEASMVDLEMMDAVLAALPDACRLVLLGDKDQLASVEAGAVLGQLCQRAAGGHYLPQVADWLQQASGACLPQSLVDAEGQVLDQAVVMLRHSHRFSLDSGIGQLADAVNQGDASRVQAILAADHPDLQVRVQVGDELAGGYCHYLQVLQQQRPGPLAGRADYDGWAHQVLSAFGDYQVLAVLRSGPWGVEALNQHIEQWLHQHGWLASGGWYLGRPVLMTRNDYGLGLMNGDVGITLELSQPDGTKQLRVAFAAGDGSAGIHWVLPSRLQAAETVFAMTVHKSQGSEFTDVALVLPQQPTQVLTRELVYTGITRARRRLTLVNPGGAVLLQQALSRRVLR